MSDWVNLFHVTLDSKGLAIRLRLNFSGTSGGLG